MCCYCICACLAFAFCCHMCVRIAVVFVCFLPLHRAHFAVAFMRVCCHLWACFVVAPVYVLLLHLYMLRCHIHVLFVFTSVRVLSRPLCTFCCCIPMHFAVASCVCFAVAFVRILPLYLCVFGCIVHVSLSHLCFGVNVVCTQVHHDHFTCVHHDGCCSN